MATMSNKPAGTSKIAEKITKLIQKAQSAQAIGSLAEAEAFLAKANEMLLEHNIEMSSLDMNGPKSKGPSITKNTVSFHDNQAGSRWRKSLLSILCEFNFCSFVTSSWSNKGTYVDQHFADVIGQRDNIDTVVYLFNNLGTQLLILAQDAYKALPNRPTRYSFLKDFLLGAMVGLRQKLTEVRAEQETRFDNIGGLVLYNAAAISEYTTLQYPDLRSVKSRVVRVNAETYAKGVKAGRNVKEQKAGVNAKQATQIAS